MLWLCNTETKQNKIKHSLLIIRVKIGPFLNEIILNHYAYLPLPALRSQALFLLRAGGGGSGSAPPAGG